MKIGVKLALAQSLLLLALGLAFAMAVSMQLGERLRARSDAVQDRVVEDALGMLDAYNQALKGSVDQYARMFESELIGQFTLDTCRIPSDHIPIRSWPLFLARELMRDLIETLKAEQST